MTRRFFGKMLAQAAFGMYAAIPILSSPFQAAKATKPLPEPNAIDMSAGPLSPKRKAWPKLDMEQFAQRCQIAWELKHNELYGTGLPEELIGVNGCGRGGYSKSDPRYEGRG